MLFSVHLKATMMKVSDPIIFGHAVRAYFPAVFSEHADALSHLDPQAHLDRRIDRVQPAACRIPERADPLVDCTLASTSELSEVQLNKVIQETLSLLEHIGARKINELKKEQKAGGGVTM